MVDTRNIKSRDKEVLGITYTREDGMVLFFVPNKDEFEHYHIELNTAEYIALYSFLSNYAPEPTKD